MIAGMRDEKIKSLLLASKSAGPLKVGFLLITNFSMLAFASAIEPLRAANRMAGEELFSWVISSPNGQPTEASNGVVVSADGDPEILQKLPPCFCLCRSRYQKILYQRHAECDS